MRPLYSSSLPQTGARRPFGAAWRWSASGSGATSTSAAARRPGRWFRIDKSQAGEFYSYARQKFWSQGFGGRAFARQLLNRSFTGRLRTRSAPETGCVAVWPHEDGRTCRDLDLELTRTSSMVGQAFVSGCLPGDIIQFIGNSRRPTDTTTFRPLVRSGMPAGASWQLRSAPR